MARPFAEWRTLKTGDVLRMRPKRSPGERFDVVVHTVLERHYANGHGFLDEHGTEFRQWFYDLEFRLTPGLTELR